MEQVLMKTEMPDVGVPVRGKVRDIYDLGDHLLLVATDRISAFDVVLPDGIPGKGKVLTQLSRFWSLKDYKPGGAQDSFDKQIVRDYLNGLAWDKTPPGPSLPVEVINRTAMRYREILSILTASRLRVARTSSL